MTECTDDRGQLLKLIAALDGVPRALQREQCGGELGDWIIAGKHGHALPDGRGML